MKQIASESDFQKWVMDRFDALTVVLGKEGHAQDFSAFHDDVPDVNFMVRGVDYWLELKFGRFKLLHSGYERFHWRTAQSGQLAWLEKREKAGAVAGLLGYAIMFGNSSETPYLTFHTVAQYKAALEGKHDVGAIMLSPQSACAHYIKTGQGLLNFITHARDGRPYSDRPL